MRIDVRESRRRALAALVGAAGLLVVLGTGPAAAQTPPDDPVEAIRVRNETVRSILEAAGDSVDAAERERLKDVINGLIDFDELSRRALTRHWEGLSEQERRDFVDVFRGLVRNSSVKKLGAYRADSIEYEPARIRDSSAIVLTVAWKDGKSAEVEYRLHRAAGEWKAWDVIVDGSSTVRTYRDSFDRQIEKSSYAELYRKLSDKLAEEEEEAG
ncbi:MAG: ABC transporter substrate-binding protein [Gemmatimonadota bacterium]|nr:ABC transporter substrate-binding protein [Gemmatimonadota bacterium]